MSYSYLVTKTIPHRRAVCSLYKRAVRNIEAWATERDTFRYQAVKLRARFDENKNITSLETAKELLEEGERELWKKMHHQPLKFADSPGGVAFERYVQPPDWVLDYWHPFEKAQYPKYFATREKRKLEYIEMYEKFMKEHNFQRKDSH